MNYKIKGNGPSLLTYLTHIIDLFILSSIRTSLICVSTLSIHTCKSILNRYLENNLFNK